MPGVRFWVTFYGEAHAENVAVSEVGARDGSAISRTTGYGVAHLPYIRLRELVNPECGNPQTGIVEGRGLSNALRNAEVPFFKYETGQLAVIVPVAGFVCFSLLLSRCPEQYLSAKT